jgi:hypothetical protein
MLVLSFNHLHDGNDDTVLGTADNDAPPIIMLDDHTPKNHDHASGGENRDKNRAFAHLIDATASSSPQVLKLVHQTSKKLKNGKEKNVWNDKKLQEGKDRIGIGTTNANDDSSLLVDDDAVLFLGTDTSTTFLGTADNDAPPIIMLDDHTPKNHDHVSGGENRDKNRAFAHLIDATASSSPQVLKLVHQTSKKLKNGKEKNVLNDKKLQEGKDRIGIGTTNANDDSSLLVDDDAVVFGMDNTGTAAYQKEAGLLVAVKKAIDLSDDTIDVVEKEEKKDTTNKVSFLFC